MLYAKVALVSQGPVSKPLSALRISFAQIDAIVYFLQK